MGKRVTVVFVVAAAALLLAACTTSRPPAPHAPEPHEAGPYEIGRGDLLGVRVWKNPELSVDVPVRPDGMISVPLLADIVAEGMAPEDLADLIATELHEYVQNAEVTVVVLQTPSKRIYVMGEVIRSGPIILNTRMRVVAAISAAGGFNAFADRDDVVIVRGDDTYHFDYDAFLAGKAPGTNILLAPGDTVVVND